MAITATQVTDSTGNYAVVGDLFMSDLQVRPLRESVVGMWDVEINPKPGKMTLGNLLKHDVYGLLAFHILDTGRYSPDTLVEIGNERRVCMIRLCDKEYRERASKISERKR
jgi:hypothetical protein